MTISVGGQLPETEVVRMSENGPEVLALSSLLAGRKVILFGLPGAFTGPCTTAHIPSFIRTADAFRAKGVEDIICLSVNDPFVLEAWGEATGATAAGISHVGDADGSFTKGLGMDFTAPHLGLVGRSSRYALLIEDGVISKANIDEPGVCNISTGEALLAEM